MKRRGIALCALIIGLACSTLVVACRGGGDSASFPTVVSLGGNQEVFPSIRNSTLAVGANRVEFGLTDKDNAPVMDAKVHVRFYDLNDKNPRFVSESDARFVPVQLSYDDAGSMSKTPAGEDAVYATSTRFERPGQWGVQVAVQIGNRKLKQLPYTFTVLDHTPEPEIGEAAPTTRQPTVQQVPNMEDIDSSYPPRPQMHEISVADALETHKPLVIAFATPAFCETRTCGPVMDTVMDPLYANYKDEAIFIHIEPYVLTELRDTNLRDLVPAMREWNLQGEPWLFVIDREGRIAAKYEGIVSKAEAESALQTAIAAVNPVSDTR